MKKAIAIIAAVLVFATAGYAAKAKKINRVVYQTTIHCENCANKVRENIAFEKGVKDLVVDAKTKKVEVKFDAEKTDTLTLRKAINKLGYKAKVVEFE